MLALGSEDIVGDGQHFGASDLQTGLLERLTLGTGKE